MIWILPALVALLCAGLLYQLVGTLLDRRRCPPPGRYIAAGPNRLHAHIQGSGGPVVVLEAGIAASSLSWTLVQPKVAEFATVLSYDRAGLGWSAPARTPRLSSQIAREFDEMLDASGLPPPYILVGHSFGGLLVYLYAARHPEKVAGLVLVDPVNLAEWTAPIPAHRLAMLRRGVSLSRRGSTLARFGIVRFALGMLMAGSRLLPKVIARAASGGAASVTERLVGEVRKLPREVWPMVMAHWCQPKNFASMAGHLEHLPESVAELARLPDPQGISVTLITAGEQEPSRFHANANTNLVIAKSSGHWVHLDEPELVVKAIRKLAEQAQIR